MLSHHTDTDHLMAAVDADEAGGHRNGDQLSVGAHVAALHRRLASAVTSTSSSSSSSLRRLLDSLGCAAGDVRHL